LGILLIISWRCLFFIDAADKNTIDTIDRHASLEPFHELFQDFFICGVTAELRLREHGHPNQLCLLEFGNLLICFPLDSSLIKGSIRVLLFSLLQIQVFLLSNQSFMMLYDAF